MGLQENVVENGEEKKRGTRGGKREGAGRPLTAGVPRKSRQTRATDEEWELIRKFSQLVKRDMEKARELLQSIETE